MIGIGIILAHLVGDYILQNNWMANEKTKRWLPAIAHGFAYIVAYTALLMIYFIVTPSNHWSFIEAFVRLVGVLLVIGGTHVVIDHFRLAKHVIWFVNQLGPQGTGYPWAEGRNNGGYSASTPAWMSTWLMIIVDNTIHLLINVAALYWIAGIR